jgi:serine/threonine-protein kinase
MRWAWAPKQRSRSAAARVARVAVLPLGVDELADGLTAELTALLARARGLEVVAHTSSRRSAAKGRALPEVAADLGATHILEGSTRRDGDTVRLAARLVEPAAERTLWSDAWSGPPEDVFAFQSEIARRVAADLGATLADGPDPILHREPTSDFAAYDEYLRGRHQLALGTDDGVRAATTRFEQAIERDSTFALAWAGLAECWLRESMRPLRAAEAARRAREAVEEALSLDRALPDAHATRGWLATASWDWAEADAALETALELAPSHPSAVHGRATFHLRRGELAEADRAYDAARALDPSSDDILNASAWPILLSGRFAEAAERARVVVHRDPEGAMAYFNLGTCAARAGRREESITYYRAAAELSARVPFFTAFLGMALVGVGDRDEAEAIAADLRRKAERGIRVATCFGALLVHLGRVDKGLAWLERGVEAREPFALAIDTWLLPVPQVRGHERFRRLVESAPRPNMIGVRP